MLRQVLSRRGFAAAPKPAAASTFHAKDLEVHPVDIKKIKPAKPGQFKFGAQYTDHMLEIDWSAQDGWAKPKIVPHGPIKIETSATALHYGISVNEGVSVLKNKDSGKLQAFRCDDHLSSFREATDHLDMPVFDPNELTECLKKLVCLDKEWINWMNEPDQFYCRLTHFSTDKTLGVRTPHHTKMLAIVNPIQFKQNKPISLKCSTGINKNWPLGHGQFRLAGNLGPLVPAVTDAKNNGFDDVLWMLDDYIKECTVLNLFVVQQSRFGHVELVTPPDDKCILNGVMRQSILEMAGQIEAQFGLKVVDRECSIHELVNSSKEGRLLEMFGAATHCPLQQISRIVYKDTTMLLNQFTDGEYSRGIDQLLTDTMRGPASHKWITAME